MHTTFHIESTSTSTGDDGEVIELSTFKNE